MFLSRDPTQWMMPTARGALPSFSRTWPLFGPEAFTMCSTWSAVNTFGYRPYPYCGTLCASTGWNPVATTIEPTWISSWRSCWPWSMAFASQTAAHTRQASVLKWMHES